MLPLILTACITWPCVSDRAADYWHIDRSLLRAVIMVESSGCKHIYSKTGDYGCVQINKVHLQGFRDYQDFSNFKFSIPIGAYLISRHPNICVYHLGKAGLKKYTGECERYKLALRRFGWKKK